MRVKQGNPEVAYEMVLVVLNHPATYQETRDRAQGLQEILVVQLTPAQFEYIQSHAEKRSFQALIDGLL